MAMLTSSAVPLVWRAWKRVDETVVLIGRHPDAAGIGLSARSGKALALPTTQSGSPLLDRRHS
jgi:hypothetical protein